jgi:biotin synthase
VPINRLVKVAGTPLAAAAELETFEFVRTLAVARLMMPRSMLRLSAGRESMSEELQALCFFAGANSIFYGEKLLTTGNPDTAADQALFGKLGLHPLPAKIEGDGAAAAAADGAAPAPAPCC